MRRKTFTVTASAGGTTYSPAYAIDTYNNPTDVGIQVNVIYGTGSALYDVQDTSSDPWTINLNADPVSNTAATGIWNNNATLTSAGTNGNTNYIAPPAAVRLALRAAVSAQVQVTIIQAGPR